MRPGSLGKTSRRWPASPSGRGAPTAAIRRIPGGATNGSGSSISSPSSERASLALPALRAPSPPAPRRRWRTGRRRSRRAGRRRNIVAPMKTRAAPLQQCLRRRRRSSSRHVWRAEGCVPDRPARSTQLLQHASGTVVDTIPCALEAQLLSCPPIRPRHPQPSCVTPQDQCDAPRPRTAAQYPTIEDPCTSTPSAGRTGAPRRRPSWARIDSWGEASRVAHRVERLEEDGGQQEGDPDVGGDRPGRMADDHP